MKILREEMPVSSLAWTTGVWGDSCFRGWSTRFGVSSCSGSGEFAGCNESESINSYVGERWERTAGDVMEVAELETHG